MPGVAGGEQMPGAVHGTLVESRVYAFKSKEINIRYNGAGKAELGEVIVTHEDYGAGELVIDATVRGQE
jgi:hypothetical protein